MPIDELIISGILAATLIGQLVQIPLLGLDVPVWDVVAGILLLVGFWQSWRSGRLAVALKRPVVKALLIFAGVILISYLAAIPALVASTSGLIISLLYALRLICYLFLGVLLVSEISWSKAARYQRIIIWGSVLFIAVGLFELAIFPDFRIYDQLGWDPHQHRLIASFLDPNFTAIWLSGATGLFLSLFLVAKSKLQKVATGALIVFGLGATLLTLSRSGLLALAGVIASIAATRWQRWMWAGGLILIAALFLVPQIRGRLNGAFELDTTTRYRLASYEEAGTIIKRYPLLGIGYNTLKFRRYDVALPGTSKLISRFEDGLIRSDQLKSRADAGFDSSLLTILATTGIIGLGAFLWWVWLAVYGAWQYCRTSTTALYSRWFLAFTAGLFLSSWFVNAWLYPPILLLWLITMALADHEQQA